MCVQVHAYACGYTCVFVYMLKYRQMHMCVQVHVLGYVCMCVFVHVQVHVKSDDNFSFCCFLFFVFNEDI